RRHGSPSAPMRTAWVSLGTCSSEWLWPSGAGCPGSESSTSSPSTNCVPGWRMFAHRVARRPGPDEPSGGGCRRTDVRPLGFLIAAALLASSTASPTNSAHRAGQDPVRSHASLPSSLPDFSRIVVVVMENHEYGQIIGNPDAPYINELAQSGGLATAFYGIDHPSLPNYLALTGGSTFGIGSDCGSCQVD